MPPPTLCNLPQSPSFVNLVAAYNFKRQQPRTPWPTILIPSQRRRKDYICNKNLWAKQNRLRQSHLKCHFTGTQFPVCPLLFCTMPKLQSGCAGPASLGLVFFFCASLEEKKILFLSAIPPLTCPARSCFIFEPSITQTLGAYLSSAIWIPYLILKHVQIMTTFFSQLIYGLWGPFFICYHALPFDLPYLSSASASVVYKSSTPALSWCPRYIGTTPY